MHNYFVYKLKSQMLPERYYIGFTENVHKRLLHHNAGLSIHTNKYRPWLLQVYVAFSDEKKARVFEEYLKSGSGRAFCKKHF